MTTEALAAARPALVRRGLWLNYITSRDGRRQYQTAM
jgi:hypothetical protein